MARAHARRDPAHKEWDVVLRRTTFVTVRVRATRRDDARTLALRAPEHETAATRIISTDQGDTKVSYAQEVRK